MTVVRAVKIIKMKYKPNFEAWIGKGGLYIASTAPFECLGNLGMFITIENCPHLIAFLKR
ncbi:hypothetical protein AQZ49_10640 [Novosphingobium sp. FSW06-99]|nr:hypothetical protein AQZ49_10640 [Novosphingobium sp. FSW06-99]